jgi:hypothetical protein
LNSEGKTVHKVFKFSLDCVGLSLSFEDDQYMALTIQKPFIYPKRKEFMIISALSQGWFDFHCVFFPQKFAN